MRKVKTGSGMTADEFSVPDTPEEIAAAQTAMVEAWRVAGSGFEIVISPIEHWAQRQMARFGYADLEAFRRADPPLSESLEDRALGYAVDVLNNIDITRNAIRKGDAQEAARFGVRVGEIFTRIQMTMEWEGYTTGLRSGGHVKGGETMAARAADHTAYIRAAVVDILRNRTTFDWDDGRIVTWLMKPERDFQTYKGRVRGRKAMMRYVATIRAEWKARK